MKKILLAVLVTVGFALPFAFQPRAVAEPNLNYETLYRCCINPSGEFIINAFCIPIGNDYCFSEGVCFQKVPCSE